MILVKLRGGLGNQLFQYALGRRLALRCGAPLKLDLSFYEGQTLRSYGLSYYNIAASVASPKEVMVVTRTGRSGILPRLGQVVRSLLPYHRRRYIRERMLRFDPEVLRVKAPAYLVGYWQSEKYFQGIADVLRRDLTLAVPPSPESRATRARLDAVESVSLHIRRGDYASNPSTRAHHGLCGLDYYRAAAAEMARMVREPHLFVFSDDMAWAKDNLGLEHVTTYVDHNAEKRDHEDLWLMSACKHHILANSSFSWWGAWLSKHPDKTIIAPKNWFADPNGDIDDLLPSTWIRM